MKCFVCNTKLNKMFKQLYTCKCGQITCTKHKACHKCTYDFHEEHKKECTKKLIKVVSAKIEKI